MTRLASCMNEELVQAKRAALVDSMMRLWNGAGEFLLVIADPAATDALTENSAWHTTPRHQGSPRRDRGEAAGEWFVYEVFLKQPISL